MAAHTTTSAPVLEVQQSQLDRETSAGEPQQQLEAQETQSTGQNPHILTTGEDDSEIYVELTHAHLDAQAVMNKVKSPKAGAIVLFAGTTRDSFALLPVTSLSYSTYPPLALRTLRRIATAIKHKYALQGIALVHRLGTVPIGEESILIAVSAAHRHAAWKAGEEALEECKEKVEIWKLESFAEGADVARIGGGGTADGGPEEGSPGSEGQEQEGQGEEEEEEEGGGGQGRGQGQGQGGAGAVWRANRDGQAGVWVRGNYTDAGYADGWNTMNGNGRGTGTDRGNAR